LRFATAAGASDRLRLDLLINEIIYEAISKNKITLKSDGKAKRPFIDVKDMCNSIFSCIKLNFKENFNVFNVGSNENNFSVIDIANKIANSTNVSTIKIGEAADSRSYDVDFSKFKSLDLNFSFSSIDQTINELIYSVKDNIDLIKSKEIYLKRLTKLEKLIEQSKINNNLFWV